MADFFRAPDILKPIWAFLLPGKLLGTFFGFARPSKRNFEECEAKRFELQVKTAKGSLLQFVCVWFPAVAINQIPIFSFAYQGLQNGKST